MPDTRKFEEARSAAQPDKDLILTVAKINGSEELQTCRVSDMTWWGWIVYLLGFGPSSLSSVAHFLQYHEPYIPKFSRLQDREFLALFYDDGEIDEWMNQDKQTVKQIRDQKIKGCEIFKRCLIHHNQRHYCQVHVLFQEYEKKHFTSWGSCSWGDVSTSWPNPMGAFPAGNEDHYREKFVPAKIDIEAEEFLYLDPFFRRHETKDLLPKVAGFCYEIGLGTEKNLDEAEKYYREAVDQEEYSAHYNLGRMLFEKGEFFEAIDVLVRGVDLLSDRMDQAQQVIDKNNTPPAHLKGKDLKRYKRAMKPQNQFAERCITEWNKAVNQIYRVLVEAYRENGNLQEADKIEQLIE